MGLICHQGTYEYMQYVYYLNLKSLETISMSQLSGRKLRGRCEFGHKTSLNKLLALNSVAVSQNLVDRSKFGPNAS